eukprot:s837_g21.t1
MAAPGFQSLPQGEDDVSEEPAIPVPEAHEDPPLGAGRTWAAPSHPVLTFVEKHGAKSPEFSSDRKGANNCLDKGRHRCGQMPRLGHVEV